MSKLQIFYAEGGRYVSDEYSRASVGDIAFGGELNQTKLYGAQPIYTEPHPFMYVSDAVSDADGVLESQTSVNVERQNINGLTMIFDPAGGTHPKRVDLILTSITDSGTEYISASNSVIVDGPMCNVNIAAENAIRLSVAMSGLNAPYVRHKLTTIYNGAMTMYDEDRIISCDIIEQIDVLSETLPTNTCDIMLIEPNGMTLNRSARQRIEVYRDGGLRGVFFFDSVTKTGKYRYAISAHGYTGELDVNPFIGDVYKEKDTAQLTAEIFAAAEIVNKTDAAFPVPSISGHLPISSCKDALRTMLFAAGLTLDVSRSQYPRVRYIDVTSFGTGKTVTDALIGEAITEESQIAAVELKTRVYVDPNDENINSMQSQRYTYKEYGKGFKPIIIIPEVPSVINRNAVMNAVMEGSSANRILWDGTKYYIYQDENGQQYTSDEWYADLYPYIVRESVLRVENPNAYGGTVIYDNTLISPDNAQTIAERCLNWYARSQTLNVSIVGDVKLGENIAVEISDGVVFTGTVTQIRYSPVGNRMIQEVVMRGTDNGSYARRL